mgnify:CR=1 FL=1
MARRANGFDLSKAVIIVDYFTGKNTCYVHVTYFVLVERVPCISRGDKPRC